jgi:hypothetical protein
MLEFMLEIDGFALATMIRQPRSGVAFTDQTLQVVIHYHVLPAGSAGVSPASGAGQRPTLPGWKSRLVSEAHTSTYSSVLTTPLA